MTVPEKQNAQVIEKIIQELGGLVSESELDLLKAEAVAKHEEKDRKIRKE